MAGFGATVEWSRDGAAFVDGRYSRKHAWRFDGGLEVPASSSPGVVPAPYSDPAAVDPEEAFVAALSSCHMLWFLSIAAGRSLLVESYRDQADGVMEKNEEGVVAITRVTLRPRAVFGAERIPSESEIRELHHEAHRQCFLANSVKTEIRCEPILD
jgi:organic hydroperoxide reductase OsmC/OhrA